MVFEVWDIMNRIDSAYRYAVEMSEYCEYISGVED